MRRDWICATCKHHWSQHSKETFEYPCGQAGCVCVRFLGLRDADNTSRIDYMSIEELTLP